MAIDKHLRRCEGNHCMGVVTGQAADLEGFIQGLTEAKILGLDAKHLTDCGTKEVMHHTQYRALFGKKCSDEEFAKIVEQAKGMGWT